MSPHRVAGALSLLLIACAAAPAVRPGVLAAAGVQANPAMCPDGDGGWFLAWQEIEPDGQYAVHVRRFDLGGVPRWPAAPVCPACLAALDQSDPRIVASRRAAIVAWRAGASLSLQRVSATGEMLWPAGDTGLLPTQVGARPAMLPDGSGGAVVAYVGLREGTGDLVLRAQRLDSMRVRKWGTDGLELDGGSPGDPVMAPDGGGGYLVAWCNGSGASTDVHAARVSAAGAVLWRRRVANLPAERPGGGVFGRRRPALVADGWGGAIVAWLHVCLVETLCPGRGSWVCAQRLDAAGAPQWADDTLGICAVAADEYGPTLVSDGAGGAVVTWGDARGKVYAQHVDAAGAPRWDPEGIPVGAVTEEDPYAAPPPRAVPDGWGGVIVSWLDSRTDPPGLFARRLNEWGEPRWEREVRPGGSVLVRDLALLEDDSGGAILAWRERRDGLNDIVCAQLVNYRGTLLWAYEGVTPTLVSLVSAEAGPGRARLVWLSSSAGARFEVQRRTAPGAWVTRGSVAPDGAGRLSFEDRDLAAGTRYGYRLAIAEAGGTSFAGEVWLDVPSRAALALGAPRPNPAGARLEVSFTLAREGAAVLELLDPAGRRVERRSLDEPGPGPHRVEIATAGLRPGLYLLRLTQDGRSVTRRAVVTR